MEVLERIKQLCNEKGWSMYKLAEESMLTQSTISNMFVRKSYPSIPTLIKICEALGISLAEFFLEKETSTQTTEEKILIENYRKLTPKNKEAINKLISNLQ